MTETKKIYYGFADGGARNNPGPCACGVVIKNSPTDSLEKALLAKGKYLGEDTNNVAEWQGLILCLEEAIANNYLPIIIKLDSLLVVSQVNNKWKVKAENLRVYYNRAKVLINNIIAAGSNVSIEHTLRAGNIDADTVVNNVLDNR